MFLQCHQIPCLGDDRTRHCCMERPDPDRASAYACRKSSSPSWLQQDWQPCWLPSQKLGCFLLHSSEPCEDFKNEELSIYTDVSFPQDDLRLSISLAFVNSTQLNSEDVPGKDVQVSCCACSCWLTNEALTTYPSALFQKREILLQPCGQRSSPERLAVGHLAPLDHLHSAC